MRRSRKEAHSVNDYRRTLGVLGHLGETAHSPDDPAAGTIAPDESRSPTAPAGPTGVHAPVGLERSPRRARIGSSAHPLVFDDASAGRQTAVGARGREKDRALSVIQRPAHRLGSVVGVVLLCLVVAAAIGAYAVERARHDAAAHTAAGQHISGAGHSGGQPSRHTGTGSGTGSGSKTTPTTEPSRYLPLDATPTSATYVPRTAKYKLTVGALSVPCWVSVTSSSGTVVLEQTFSPGASATVSLSGTSTLDVGAPKAVSLDVGGIPATVPPTAVGPFAVTLAPAGSPGA